MLDFPAAHSMDTQWFATDADGNLAIFWSNEDGAVPKSNSFGEISDFLDELPKDEQGIVCLKVDGEVVAKGVTQEKLQEIINWNKFDTFYEWLFVLSTEDAIQQLKSNTNFILRFSGAKIVVYIDEFCALTVQNLIESGEILEGKSFEVKSDYFKANYHLLGFFTYEHGSEWENWIAGPYELVQKPEVPLKLEDLPDSLQEAISQSRFEQLHFEITQLIQPIEHMECDTWGGDKCWVDINGNEHEEE